IALLVPATGSMWPLYGTAVRCERNTGSGQFPRGFVESWGRAVTQVDAEYRLHAGYSLAGRGRMEMTAMVGRATGETMLLDAQASGGAIRLSWSDTTVYVRATGAGGTLTTLASLP